MKGWCFGLKEKKVLDTTTDKQDDLFKEAKESKIRNKILVRTKWTAIVAFATIIIALVLLTIRDKNPDIGVASIEVEYPQPYSFIDFDAEKELREENPIDDNFIKAINEFSYKTSTNILTDTGENINYSPLSLYFALSLAASGAEGETEEQLLALLGVSDKEFLSEQCGNFYRMYYKDNEIGKLKIANSIWMDHEYKGKLVIFKD